MIGLEETAVLVFIKSASVQDFMISEIAEAKTTRLPYSSESSSCFNDKLLVLFVNKTSKHLEKQNTSNTAK
jgi:hypothetical protein